jgi:site-specific DNA recombinase
MKNTTPSHHPSATPAVLYIRVSTDEQADHGVSLHAQETKLRAYCELRSLDGVEVVTDAGDNERSLRNWPDRGLPHAKVQRFS